MSRFHIHISVHDLQQNVAFYSTVFGQEPSLYKEDYAKWVLDDPDINFAISTRGSGEGLDHIGLQAENDAELKEIRQRLESAGIQGVAEEGTTCCYAKSDKYWVQDPQGIAWETFHSLQTTPMYGQAPERSKQSCCLPSLTNCC